MIQRGGEERGKERTEMETQRRLEGILRGVQIRETEDGPITDRHIGDAHIGELFHSRYICISLFNRPQIETVFPTQEMCLLKTLSRLLSQILSPLRG